jgi:hypothetical protein
MRLKEKFPFYFAMLTMVYFVMLAFSIYILIGPGLALGVYNYPEFWVFSIIPSLPLFALFGYINNVNSKTEGTWRVINLVLISVTALVFVVFIFPLALT